MAFPNPYNMDLGVKWYGRSHFSIVWLYYMSKSVAVCFLFLIWGDCSRILFGPLITPFPASRGSSSIDWIRFLDITQKLQTGAIIGDLPCACAIEQA